MPPDSGNRITTFLGEPPFPYIQSHRGLTSLLFSRMGLSSCGQSVFFILLVSGVGPGMGIGLKPDNEARFSHGKSPIEIRNLSGFHRVLHALPENPSHALALLFSYLSSSEKRSAETKMIFNLMPLHKRKIGL